MPKHALNSLGGLPGASPINRNSAVPAYFQILHQLRQLMDTGALGAGELLPSEQELAELFEVNKLTIRRAIQELVIEGRVIRRQGRRSQVAGPKVQLDPVDSFADQVEKLGLSHHTTIQSCRLVKPPESVRSRGITAPGQKMLHLVRVRWLEDDPVAVEDNYLIEEYSAIFLRDMSKGERLYETFKSDLGLTDWEVEVELELESASSEDATRLDTREGRPLLSLRQTLISQGGPFGHTYVRFLAERFHFHIGVRKYGASGQAT